MLGEYTEQTRLLWWLPEACIIDSQLYIADYVLLPRSIAPLQPLPSNSLTGGPTIQMLC